MEDESAGYHPHHTVWSWSAGVGRTMDGRSVGWNLVSGINDPPERSERAIWLAGEPFEPGPVSFEDLEAIAFDDGARLEFAGECERSREENRIVARYAYRQPFGSFSGSLAAGSSSSGARGHGAPRRPLVTAAQIAFAANWALTSWLAACHGTPVGSPADLEIGSPIYLTTVVRLPAEIAGRSPRRRRGWPVSARATTCTRPAASISRFVGSPTSPEPEPMVEAALDGHRRFEVEVRGLNVTLDTVFAELHPSGPGLGAVRRDLRAGESTSTGRRPGGFDDDSPTPT